MKSELRPTEPSRHATSITAGALLTMTFLVVVAGALTTYDTFGNGTAVRTQTIVTQTIVSTSTVDRAGVANGSLSGIDSVRIYQETNESVVTVQGYVSSTILTFFGPQTATSQVLGSGFVVDYNNAYYVVTNFHVVDSAQNMTVRFSDGDAYPATVVGMDPYSDLAIVKVSSAPLSEYRPLTIASSSSLRVGQAVAAIGNPFGLSGSMTVGIVSQLGRTISDPSAGKFSIADIIQFSAPINPGNSGGPLLNADRLVVGLTTATVSGSQGVGFAIPSDSVLREIGALVANGSYSQHPYVGISGIDMTYQLAQATDNDITYGVLVEQVVPGGPAQRAGIVAGNKQVSIEGQTYAVGGDVIVSVNGTRIVNYDELTSYLEEHTTPGHVIELGVTRSGAAITVSLVVGTRPPQSSL